MVVEMEFYNVRTFVYIRVGEDYRILIRQKKDVIAFALQYLLDFIRLEVKEKVILRVDGRTKDFLDSNNNQAKLIKRRMKQMGIVLDEELLRNRNDRFIYNQAIGKKYRLEMDRKIPVILTMRLDNPKGGKMKKVKKKHFVKSVEW